MRRHRFDVDEAGRGADAIAADAPQGATSATLVGFDGNGLALVDIPGEPRQAARSCVPLDGTHVGKTVVVVPDSRTVHSPIVIGVMHSPFKKPVEFIADGQKVTVRADESITLNCGEASITLSGDGRIVIRGKYVVTQASCVNRIRGGSIEMN